MISRKLRMPTEQWRRDLYILWISCFTVGLGFSMVMPFLSLYLEELGVEGSAVDMWSGIIFSANFLVMAVVSPFWGAMSDRVGRKPMMLRSAFGMGLVIWMMGLVHNPWQLLALRLLQGLTAGYIAVATSYMASKAPREHAGQALGMLGTGHVTGNILGPLAGGVLADMMGYRPIFFITSISCFLAGLMVLLLIHEDFKPSPKAAESDRTSQQHIFSQYPVVLPMMGVLFLNTFSVLTVEPILARFLQTLAAPAGALSFLSGLVFSMTGVANVLVAPRMGRLSDRIGSRQLLLVCLGGGAVLYVLQGFATAVWHMILLRFLLGLFTGGLMPVANGLLARAVPRDVQGRVFGFSQTAISLGQTLGPLAGGAVAASFGIKSVFPLTGALLVVDLLWVLNAIRDEVPRVSAQPQAEPQPASK